MLECADLWLCSRLLEPLFALLQSRVRKFHTFFVEVTWHDLKAFFEDRCRRVARKKNTVRDEAQSEE